MLPGWEVATFLPGLSSMCELGVDTGTHERRVLCHGEESGPESSRVWRCWQESHSLHWQASISQSLTKIESPQPGPQTGPGAATPRGDPEQPPPHPCRNLPFLRRCGWNCAPESADPLSLFWKGRVQRPVTPKSFCDKALRFFLRLLCYLHQKWQLALAWVREVAAGVQTFCRAVEVIMQCSAGGVAGFLLWCDTGLQEHHAGLIKAPAPHPWPASCSRSDPLLWL